MRSLLQGGRGTAPPATQGTASRSTRQGVAAVSGLTGRWTALLGALDEPAQGEQVAAPAKPGDRALDDRRDERVVTEGLAPGDVAEVDLDGREGHRLEAVVQRDRV